MRWALCYLLSAVAAGAQVPEEMLLTLAPPAAAGGTPASSLITNLVAYWRMDETSGQRADAVGSETLTDVNTVGYITGIITNGSFHVRTSSEFLSRNDDAALSTENASFTLAGWILTTTTNQAYGVASKYTATDNGREWAIWCNGGNIRVTYWTNGANLTTVNNSLELPTNAWCFVAAVIDTNALKMTCFAASDLTQLSVWATNAIAGWKTTSTAGRLAIGNDDYSGGYWDGGLDEWAFWKRNLSSNEIINYYMYSKNGTNYPWTGLP